MYPVGTGTKEDFERRWYIALGFGEAQSYGYHEGIDINLKTGGDTDLGEPILAVADYKLVYYHLKSHLESGFGIHFVYEIDTPKGKRWVHCAHNQPDPLISSKKEGRRGDIIAHIGKSGRPRNSLPAHLHLSIFKVDPGSLPSGIDTIAKTTKQLNDWWESPIEVFESLKDNNMGLPEWFKTLLQEANLSLDREGEFRSFWDKAKRYDDEVSGLREQIKTVNEQLADRAREVSLLIEKNQKLEGRATDAEEQLGNARSERDTAIGEKIRMEARVGALEDEIEALQKRVEGFKEKNDLYAYTWFERFKSLFGR